MGKPKQANFFVCDRQTVRTRITSHRTRRLIWLFTNCLLQNYYLNRNKKKRDTTSIILIRELIDTRGIYGCTEERDKQKISA